MKRRFYILIIVLSFGIIVNAQNSNDELGFEMEMDSTIIGKDMCETAKNMAKRDIVNGRYAAFFHGYRGNNSQTFERLMVRKYGVYASRTGLCSGDEFSSNNSDTYCFEMLSLVLALSGSNVGRTYLAQQLVLVKDLLALLHTGSGRIQRQVIYFLI